LLLAALSSLVQEVWADADTDQSLIVELNTLDESVSDAEVAAHYMAELAQANEAHSSTLVSAGPIDAAAMPGFESVDGRRIIQQC
jgi:hypothetical protein